MKPRRGNFMCRAHFIRQGNAVCLTGYKYNRRKIHYSKVPRIKQQVRETQETCKADPLTKNNMSYLWLNQTSAFRAFTYQHFCCFVRFPWRRTGGWLEFGFVEDDSSPCTCWKGRKLTSGCQEIKTFFFWFLSFFSSPSQTHCLDSFFTLLFPASTLQKRGRASQT